MKRSEAIDQLREMDAKYSCYVYCKNELAVVLGEQLTALYRNFYRFPRLDYAFDPAVAE